MVWIWSLDCLLLGYETSNDLSSRSSKRRLWVQSFVVQHRRFRYSCFRFVTYLICEWILRFGNFLYNHTKFLTTPISYIFTTSLSTTTPNVWSVTPLYSLQSTTTPNLWPHQTHWHTLHISTSIFWPHQIDVHVQQDTLYPTTPNVITPNVTTPNHCWQTLYNHNKFLTTPNEVRCTTCTTTTRPHQITNHRESSPSMTDIFLDFTPWVHVSVHVHIFK